MLDRTVYTQPGQKVNGIGQTQNKSLAKKNKRANQLGDRQIGFQICHSQVNQIASACDGNNDC